MLTRTQHAFCFPSSSAAHFCIASDSICPRPHCLSWPIPHPVLDRFQRQCTALIRPPCSLPPPTGPEPMEHIHTHLLIPHLTSRDLQCSGKQSINTEKTLPEKLRGLYSQTNILGIPAYYRMGVEVGGGRGRRRDEGGESQWQTMRAETQKMAPKYATFPHHCSQLCKHPPRFRGVSDARAHPSTCFRVLARASRAACTFLFFSFLFFSSSFFFFFWLAHAHARPD